MNISRRQFLRISGGGIILAVGASAAGFLLTRTPYKALAPWQQAGTYEEIRRRSLSYAILAPNPHNRQPWLVDLADANVATLYVDTQRLLKETDPYNRQITIGLGCFLELATMAAAEAGWRVDLSLFPKGADPVALDKRPVARMEFRQDATISSDPLFTQVLKRRSSKEPFDSTRSVAASELEILHQAVAEQVMIGSTNIQEEVLALRELSWNAFVREYRTPAKLQESIDLMRFGKTAIEASPDGIDLGGPLMESLQLLGVLNRESLTDVKSSAFQQGLDMAKEQFETSQAFVWLTTPTNERVSQINAGRAWVRLNLAATGIGLGVHPISQALQEYAEMKEYYQAIHKRLAPSDGTVQMLGRLGYADEVSPSPRWPLEKRITSA